MCEVDLPVRVRAVGLVLAFGLLRYVILILLLVLLVVEVHVVVAVVVLLLLLLAVVVVLVLLLLVCSEKTKGLTHHLTIQECLP